MKEHEVSLLIVIGGWEDKDRLIAHLKNHDAHYFNVIYGHGSVKKSNLFHAFGLQIEQDKTIIYCFVKNEKVDEIMNSLIKEFNFDKPNTGIAFTLPILDVVK